MPSTTGSPGPASGADGQAVVDGSTRFGRFPIASRQTFVAILKSQGRSGLPPSKPSEAPPGAQQRLLESVLGVVERAEHPVAVRVERRPMRLDQARVRVLVAVRASSRRVRSSTLIERA